MKKFGFTLAEVLIALVIIGIIAAITIPALMNNTNDEENIAAFKKALSVMNQAMETEYALEGNTAVYTEQPMPGVPAFAKNWKGLPAIMAKRTNIVKSDIAPFGEDISSTSSSGTAMKIFATADGIIYAIPMPRYSYLSCPADTSACLFDDCEDHYPSPCGQGVIDVNGKKGPNKLSTWKNGKIEVNDRFQFAVFETSVMPGIIRTSIESRLMYGKRTSR